MLDYCLYYQARIQKEMAWFFVGCLKSCDHLAFDRTIDAENDIFEFFVPVDMEDRFVGFMRHFEQLGMVTDFIQKRNRLIDESVQ